MKLFKSALSIVMVMVLAICTFGCTGATPSEQPSNEQQALAEQAASEFAGSSFLPEGYIPNDILISSGPAGGNWNSMGVSHS